MSGMRRPYGVWTARYGELVRVSYRIPKGVKEILEAAADSLDIRVTDALIRAILHTYTDDLTPGSLGAKNDDDRK